MYFSVRKYIKIAGKTYTPCVCYDLPNELVATVEKLQSEGKATIYTEPVGFMNGKILRKEVKKVVKEQVVEAKHETLVESVMSDLDLEVKEAGGKEAWIANIDE